MKLLFAGPTLPDAESLCGTEITVHPPAAHGDVLRAVREGAVAIGIVDGSFENVAPVWHKEILHALDNGVTVIGAASMGALRAAECAAFGMVGVGGIYREFASGARMDDADVALLHGPAELGYPALSLPLVNVEATLARLEKDGTLGQTEARRLLKAARDLFYKDRTWRSVLARAGITKKQDQLIQLLNARTVDRKRRDALELIASLRLVTGKTVSKQGKWAFHATSLWRQAADQLLT